MARMTGVSIRTGVPIVPVGGKLPIL